MKRLRRDLLVAFFAIVATVAFIPLFTYYYFASDLKSKESLTSHNDTGVVLLDSKNEPFFSFYKGRLRKPVSLSDIPKFTQLAVIAIEDKDFKTHAGFSIKSILRALIENLQNKELSYGASTITQQLVKNTLLTSKKTFLRKYQEIVLASEIERRYSKDEILEMYLNSVYFGEGVFGLEEAAETYFGKSAKDLSLAESTMLIGLLPAPSKLSPIRHLENAKLHQKLVLEKMEEQKYISSLEKDIALKEELKFNSSSDEINNLAPHYALMVLDELIKKYSEEEIVRSGFKVHTSLNLDLQRYAEEIVASHVDKLKKNRANNGAAVILDPKTGEILAMVGSKDWYDNKFGKVNMALSPRQTGSSFKPLVYLKGFEKGVINPSSILMDVPTKFANFDEETFFSRFPTKAAAMENISKDPNAYYSPLNFDRRFRGPVTVRRALSNSLNIPAVAVMKKVGLDDAIEIAQRLGITGIKDSSNYGLSFVLGTVETSLLEMTSIYATFANMGIQNDPTAILDIKDKTGKTIYKYQPKQQRKIDEKNVFLLNSILSDNKARVEQFGNLLNISRVAAVKTGTTEDFKDAWTLGYTPQIAVGVWVGNNFGEPMDNVAGSLGAAPIWKALIEKALEEKPVEQFTMPEGIITLFCYTKEASSSGDYFIKGTEPRNCTNLIKEPSSSVMPNLTQESTTSGVLGAKESVNSKNKQRKKN